MRHTLMYIFTYDQGRIFPKIQPTTICRIELTSDKNQAKTQQRSGLITKLRPFLNSAEHIDSLFGLIHEF